MSWTLISTDADLGLVLESLRSATEIAIDTEFMRRNTYYPQVALLQISAGGEAWLIDPLAITSTDGLRELMVNPGINKVLHSCSEDLEVFRRWLGVLPVPLVDTQKAAALLGEEHGMGYRALVQKLLGIELEKGETRSDWLRRPLSESQCHYAAQDVVQLFRVWQCLKARALASDRLPWIMEEGEEAARALAERDREQYRRIKSVARLDPRQLATLQRISDWREQRAQDSDKPRGWILDDKVCLSIAREMPADQAALESIEGMPHSVARRQGPALLACVEAARSLDATALPDALPGPLSPLQRRRLKTLRSAAREIAQAADLAPEILVSGADLEQLLREADGDVGGVPPRWQGWRRELVIEPLRRQLQASS